MLQIETWAIGDVVKPREGIVSMEEYVGSFLHLLCSSACSVVKSRAQAQTQPRIVPLPDDDEDGGADSDDSDKKSKMSFSYWGADKVTVQKPVLKGGRLAVATRRGAHAASYGRESSANAKFGSRLVSAESSVAPRPASRRAAGTPTSRRGDDGPNHAKATVTRPEWNTSTRPPLGTTTPVPAKRPRNVSQTGGARPIAAAAAAKGVASPAPSEDSGVGFLYRQVLANDPSLNHV